jgi:hypothetical protein
VEDDGITPHERYDALPQSLVDIPGAPYALPVQCGQSDLLVLVAQNALHSGAGLYEQTGAPAKMKMEVWAALARERALQYVRYVHYKHCQQDEMVVMALPLDVLRLALAPAQYPA